MDVLQRVDAPDRDDGRATGRRGGPLRDLDAVVDDADAPGLDPEALLPARVRVGDGAHDVGERVRGACEAAGQPCRNEARRGGRQSPHRVEVGLADVDAVLAQHERCPVEGTVDEGRNRGPACRRHEQGVAGRRLDGRRSGHPVQRLVEASRVDGVESRRRQRVLGPLGEHVAKPGEEGRPSGARAEDRADRPRLAPAPDECVEQPLSVRVPAEQLAYEDGRKLSRVRPGTVEAARRQLRRPQLQAANQVDVRRELEDGQRRHARADERQQPPVELRNPAHDQVAPGGHPPYGVGVGALRDHQHAWPSHGHVRVVVQLYGPSTTTASPARPRWQSRPRSSP